MSTCPKCDNMICAARLKMEELTEELKRAQIDQSVLAEKFVATGDSMLAAQMRALDQKIFAIKDEIECIMDTIDGLRRGPFISRTPVRTNAGAKTCGH